MSCMILPKCEWEREEKSNLYFWSLQSDVAYKDDFLKKKEFLSPLPYYAMCTLVTGVQYCVSLLKDITITQITMQSVMLSSHKSSSKTAEKN